MKKISKVGFVGVFSLFCLNAFSQNEKIYLETDFPFLGIGVGTTLLMPSHSGNAAIVTENAFTGSVPLSFGGYIDRHQFQVTYYMERFIPLIEHSFPVAQANGPQDLFFSMVNVYENTFGFLYGYKIPFRLAGSGFGFYPKVGLHSIYISRNSVGNPKPAQPFQNVNGQQDMLYVDKLEIEKAVNEYYFLTAGLEFETILFANIRLYWQSIYNYGISGDVTILYEYRLKNEGVEKEGSLPVRFDNFNTSIGLRFGL